MEQFRAAKTAVTSNQDTDKQTRQAQVQRRRVQQVQAVSWVDALTRGAREFVLDPLDFPDLSVNGCGRKQAPRADGASSVKDDVSSAFSSTPAVSQATSSRGVPAPVTSSLHPGWMALAARLPKEQKHMVILQRYDSSGDWGVCACCSAWERRTIWVDRDDHFSCKHHMKAARNAHATSTHTADDCGTCAVSSAGLAKVQQLVTRFQLPPGGRRPRTAADWPPRPVL